MWFIGEKWVSDEQGRLERLATANGGEGFDLHHKNSGTPGTAHWLVDLCFEKIFWLQGAEWRGTGWQWSMVGGGEPVRKEPVCAPSGGGRERGSQQAL